MNTQAQNTTAQNATAQNATANEVATVIKKPSAKLVSAIRDTIVSGLQARRVDAINCTTIVHDIKFFESDAALVTIEKCMMSGLNIDRFVKNCHVTDKKDANFIALKVVTKIKQMMQAFAQSNVKHIDGYSLSICRNLLTVTEIDTHNLLRCLSSKVESDALAAQLNVKPYINSGVTTASTQSSSSRQMLEILNLCDVVKGRKLDAIKYKADSIAAQRLQDMLNDAFSSKAA